MRPDYTCNLGVGFFSLKDEGAAKFNGHGVGIMKDFEIFAHGALHYEMGILIDRSGGVGIEEHDLLFHDMEVCLEGRVKANS